MMSSTMRSVFVRGGSQRKALCCTRCSSAFVMSLQVLTAVGVVFIAVLAVLTVLIVAVLAVLIVVVV